MTGGAGNDEITVTITPAADPGGSDIFTVEDPGGVTAAPTCTSFSSTVVKCPVGGVAWIKGGAGNDVLSLSGGRGVALKLIHGDEGNDTVFGSEWRDVDLSGGVGDDTIDGRAGPDSINCGDGFDTVIPDPTDEVQHNCENGRVDPVAILNSLTQAGGLLSAAWTLPVGADAWELDVGTSPTRDPIGYFVDYVTSAELTQFQVEGAVGPLPPGTYFVQIISTTTYSLCTSDIDDPNCLLDFSNILSVTVPEPATVPPPLPAPPPPAAADKVLSLGAVTATSSQDVDKLGITLNPGEAVTAKLSGTVSVPGASKVFKFTSVTKQVAAGAKTKLALKLPSKAKKAVKKALKRKKKLKAKLTLVVTDGAGNSQTKKYSVRLKP